MNLQSNVSDTMLLSRLTGVIIVPNFYAAKTVLRQLTPNIIPCDDYFGYVCEKWRGSQEELSMEVKRKALTDLGRT